MLHLVNSPEFTQPFLCCRMFRSFPVFCYNHRHRSLSTDYVLGTALSTPHAVTHLLLKILRGRVFLLSTVYRWRNGGPRLEQGFGLGKSDLSLITCSAVSHTFMPSHVLDGFLRTESQKWRWDSGLHCAAERERLRPGAGQEPHWDRG